MMFDHVALDVLDHHDCVVDHHADGQHHAEEREQVDRKAQRQHARERADQRHEDRHRADERGAKALQEQIHHQHHQQNRFNQRVEHLFDRQTHEIGGVQRDLVFDAGRHGLLEFDHRLAHSLGHLHAIGAWLLINGNGGGRCAVQAVVIDVRTPPGLGTGHILETHDGAAIGIGAQDDVFVDARIDCRRLRHHREVELHLAGRRLLVHLAGTDHGILRGDRVLDVGGGDTERRHAIRVHPQPHGLVGHAQNLRLAGPFDALDRIEDVDIGVGAHIVRRVASGLVVERDDHQRAGRFLLHRHAVLRDRLRQLGQRQIHPVLHLHLRGIGVGVEREVHGDRQLPGVGAHRGHVEHVVHTGELRLDGRGHRVAHGLGVGARIGGRDLDLHGRDRRVLCDRQELGADQARQHDEQRDHRREDRPLDEEL